MQVDFRWSGSPGKKVEVVGEFPTWKVLHRMHETEPGHYSLSLELSSGIYSYKIRVDESQWLSDPENPWTDHVLDFGNSTRVVGGSEPPLFFAPCRRCWVMDSDRVLTVNVETETGARQPDQIRLLTEGGSICGHLKCRVHIRRANRVFLQFQDTVPQDATKASFGGYSEFSLPKPEEPPGPEWMKGALIYSIFLDRWFRGSSSPPDARAQLRDILSTRNVIYGGNLDGVRESLGYLCDLGVNAIALTPIYLSNSPHRYDAHDFTRVDPRLGVEKDLDRLIEACHCRGVKLILDAAFTHCHWSHPAFRDLLSYQESSKYRSWFRVNRFPVSLDDPESYAHYPRNRGLPLLDLSCDTLREHIIAVAEQWIRRGVDGLRLDAAEEAPDELWRTLRHRVRKLNPQVALIAECVTDQIIRYLGNGGADAATDFTTHELIIRAFALRQLTAKEFTELARITEFRQGPRLESYRLQFLDNHDTNRFVTQAYFYVRLRLALTYLLLRPEPVWFYYGTEQAITSRVARSEKENAWPDRMPMPPLSGQTETAVLVRWLLRLRQCFTSAELGDTCMLDAGEQLVAYERTNTKGCLTVAVNISNHPAPLMALMVDSDTVLLTVHADEPLDGMLPANSAVVLWCSRLNSMRA
ncbi:alpha-amylase family glycosyl hydrolase [Candidatus Thiosymbion oneisti]|uniref:alpha-amylase family glycosyl hydrolase n=1 Tax=Candidatus Thiosymbion oneisti TaxID=589554 RepID=UPI0010613459|nr:alpha-amylase family glycosyl hydrolase [Candidatus Thiosymbion oneisti]